MCVCPVAMPGDLLPLLVLLLLCVQAVSGASKSQGCLADPTAAYRYTGAVCRLTYPAAVVCESLNNPDPCFGHLSIALCLYPSVCVL